MVHTMTLAQYLQMWTWITEWQHKNRTERLPRYVSVVNLHMGMDKIYKTTFMDMHHRVANWQSAHNGAMPQIIGIEEDVPQPTPPTPAPIPETPALPLEPIPPVDPEPTPKKVLPNLILPDHTVSIDNIGFYAENPDLTEPFKRIIYDKVEIENGPTRFYPTNTCNREMNFKVTLLKNLPATPYQYPDGKPNFEELLNSIRECQGIHQFSSSYIGSFKALITIKIGDFKPGTAVASFNIQEIP